MQASKKMIVRLCTDQKTNGFFHTPNSSTQNIIAEEVAFLVFVG